MACLSQLGDEDTSVRMAAVEALESVIPMRHARSFDGRKVCQVISHNLFINECSKVNTSQNPST